MQVDLEPDVFTEALELTRALRGHIDLLTITGAHGVPRAPTPIAPSLSEPPPSLAPTPMVPSAIPTRERAVPAPAAPVDSNAMPDWLAAATNPTRSSATPFATRPVAPPANAPSAVPSAAPRAVSLSPEERERALEQLAVEIQSCQKCGLCAKRTQTVFARGTGSSKLCFVGEGPGAEEDAQGFPFVGPAGQLLDKMISAMGLLRDEVYVCNIVKCRPPENRKPEPGEMKACMPYLDSQLELLAPEVIVALGATAVEGLLGISGGITRLRGTWKLYKGRIAVMPTFHPAYLLRSPSAKHDVWEDLKSVLRQLGRPVPERGKRPSQ